MKFTVNEYGIYENETIGYDTKQEAIDVFTKLTDKILLKMQKDINNLQENIKGVKSNYQYIIGQLNEQATETCSNI